MWKDYVMENKEKEMTDKEMLELAAKDARYTICIDVVEGGVLFQKDSDDGRSDYSWNPLKDISDALRLADKLGMVIICRPGRIQVGLENKSIVRSASFQNWRDAKMGLKRLIVEVAAEIGRECNERQVR